MSCSNIVANSYDHYRDENLYGASAYARLAQMQRNLQYPPQFSYRQVSPYSYGMPQQMPYNCNSQMQYLSTDDINAVSSNTKYLIKKQPDIKSGSSTCLRDLEPSKDKDDDITINDMCNKHKDNVKTDIPETNTCNNNMNDTLNVISPADVNYEDNDSLSSEEQAKYNQESDDLDEPFDVRMDVNTISFGYASAANEAFGMRDPNESCIDRIEIVLASSYNGVPFGSYLVSLRNTGLSGQAIKVYNATMSRVAINSKATDTGLGDMLFKYGY